MLNKPSKYMSMTILPKLKTNKMHTNYSNIEHYISNHKRSGYIKVPNSIPSNYKLETSCSNYYNTCFNKKDAHV